MNNSECGVKRKIASGDAEKGDNAAPRAQGKPKNKPKVKHVFLCLTMWQEPRKEVLQIIRSILRFEDE